MTADDTPEIEGRTAAVLILARGGTADEAATAAGKSVRTVRRWLAQDPEFRGEVSRLRGELLGQTVGALVNAATEAVTTLRSALASDSDQIKVRAATAILTALVSVRETVDLEERVAALETGTREAAG